MFRPQLVTVTFIFFSHSFLARIPFSPRSLLQLAVLSKISTEALFFLLPDDIEGLFPLLKVPNTFL